MAVYNVTPDEIRSWPINHGGWHVAPNETRIKIGDDVEIGLYARIGDLVFIGNSAWIGHGVVIGDGSTIRDRAIVDSNTKARAIYQAGTQK